MSDRFERWLRRTLSETVELPVAGVDIRGLVAQARMRRHRRRQNAARTIGVAVVAWVAVLLVAPTPIGSSRPGLMYEKTLPDGRFVYFDPMSHERVRVNTHEAGEAWSRIKDRTAAKQETIVGVDFSRYQGFEIFSVTYVQFDPVNNENLENLSRTADSPRMPMDPKKAAIMARVLNDPEIRSKYLSGPGRPCPDERHLVDGYWFRFNVSAYDVPGLSTFYFGTGTME